ncbi:hypothetical protein [Legionella sp. W05-934-2]|uniref:hypothetical protein n=1 Tax=Legionella sp. W05-934-2 TaxID=1198649 RepID=UPI0034624FB5
MMPATSDIMSGDDITAHYLDAEDPSFKIFRYQNVVYAVRFDSQHSAPIASVELWKSNKSLNKSYRPSEAIIGMGVEGVVYKKTDDKAIKRTRHNSAYTDEGIHNLHRINHRLLEQKFMLSTHKIDQYFVLGLWNTKANNNVVFNMPRLIPGEPKDPDAVDKWVIALKKLNELGYSHPDLADNCDHDSRQNIMYTSDGLRLIDLDFGLFHYNNPTAYTQNMSEDDSRTINGNDQWIYIYNHLKSNKSAWRWAVRSFYYSNPGWSLSKSPIKLLERVEQNVILLPKDVIDELKSHKELLLTQHKTNSRVAVREYLEGRLSNRQHSFHEVSSADFALSEFQEQYSGLKGDALKRSLLKELKDSLEKVNSASEIEAIKKEFVTSGKMKVIDTAQGRTTYFLSVFGLKTDSHRAVDKLFQSAHKRIESTQSKGPKIS